MRRIGILMLILFTCFLSAEWLQAQSVNPASKANPRIPDISHMRVPRQSPHLFQRMGPPILPNSATPDVVWVECPPEAQYFGAACGTLPVPLDRRHPQGKKIEIYFEVYFHWNPGAAESAILVNVGGPGVGTTALRLPVLFLFGQNLDVHDTLLIDDRGRGFSDTIDCEELQHATAPFAQAEADCAAQLGDAASWYGTGDVAMDTDAVRDALGYDKVDYWGGSYGGEDVTAYATRFGDHLRSIVLDAPEGTPALRPFLLDGNSARATSREVRLDCLRSPTCVADHPNPDTDLEQLIQAIRGKPVQGFAYDASGNSVNVHMDEGALLYVAIYPTGKFVSIGELLAAGDALSHGDPVPLLRLGAEVTPLMADHGDPTALSTGDYFAGMCVDAHEPWDWSASVPKREKQFAHAVHELPSHFFAPFSKEAGTSLDVSLEKQCLWWEKPTPSAPVAPPHPTYPNVPTLVLSGDLDTLVPTEEVRKVAALFLGSTFVPVAEAGHETILWTMCSAMLQSQFIATLQVGDISCTQAPETIWPAVGRFPLVAADASPAEVDPDGTNEIGEAERKVVTVAVATAVDALKRTTIGSGSGVGLRAGTFQTSFDDFGNQTTTLTNCAFASDVTVNGTLVWGADLSFVADLTVSGSGTAGGALHVEGTWQAPGPAGNFKISGALGGKQVAVLVPEA
jgi:pimeloyl-ACP methyl ester carboxylesterase